MKVLMMWLWLAAGIMVMVTAKTGYDLWNVNDVKDYKPSDGFIIISPKGGDIELKSNTPKWNDFDGLSNGYGSSNYGLQREYGKVPRYYSL